MKKSFSAIETLKNIVKDESVQLSSLIPKKSYANKHKAIRGKKPLILKKLIDIMDGTGNTWETGKTTREIAMELYDNYEKDIEEARKLGAKVGQKEEYEYYVINRYCIKTRQQIAFARKRLAEKMKELNVMQKKPFVPFYSGKASPKVYFRKDFKNTIGDKVTEVRYFWHTDNDSLNELREMFKKLKEKFAYLEDEVKIAKRQNNLDENIKLGLMSMRIDNLKNERKKKVIYT